MALRTRVLWCGLPLWLSACFLGPRTVAAPAVRLREEPGQIRLEVGGKPIARYVFQDPRIRRPYFCDVREPGGEPVTRSHPPVEGQDPTDHDTMHPGLWLAFGDLGGSDFWRNRGRVEQIRFLEAPHSLPGQDGGRFVVRNRYVTEAGTTYALETSRVTVLPRANSILLLLDSEFVPEGVDLAFGDQEEMGLGIRMATPLAVTRGGRIRNRDGKENEKAVRGTNAAWCDYSGVRDGRRVGICLMPDPANFRPSWYHARDYGLLVANPFGRQALTGGEKSQVLVKRGEHLRLRYGVLIHGAPGEAGVDLPAAYEEFLRTLRSMP